jgi:hypothetical protein
LDKAKAADERQKIRKKKRAFKMRRDAAFKLNV